LRARSFSPARRRRSGKLKSREFALNEGSEDLFRGKLKEVFPDEEVLVHIGGGVFDKSLVFISNQENADGRIVRLFADLGAIVVQVGVELSCVFMGEGSHFQLDEDMAFENAVVKHEIDEEVFLADEKTLLAGFETEAMSEFQEEVLKMVEEGCFKVAFFDGEMIREAEELESVNVFGEVAGQAGAGVFLSDSGEKFGVVRKTGTLEVEAGNLAFQLAHRPSSLDGFNFVEGAFEWVFDGKEQREVSIG